MRLTNLVEADLSRRQFLKLGGKAAMAAAAPKTALKGLVGAAAAPSASNVLYNKDGYKLIKVTSAEELNKVLAGLQDNVLRVLGPTWMGKQRFLPPLTPESAKDYLKHFDQLYAGLKDGRVMWMAEKDWGVSDGVDFLGDFSPRVREMLTSVPGQPFDDTFKIRDIKREQGKMATKRDAELRAQEETKKKQKQEFDEAPPPSDEPESWRTQSVEFENRLHRLL